MNEGVEPITHGTGVTVHHDDLDIYEALRQTYFDVGDNAELATYTPSFADDEYHVLFTSSKWKAGEMKNGDYQPYYEYIIYCRVERDDNDEMRVPPERLKIQFQPQKPDMAHPDGNDYRLPHGVGTRLEIETTYVDRPTAVRDRAEELLDVVLDDYDPGGLKWQDTCTIKKLEEHVRFGRDQAPVAIRSLQNTERLISWMGRSDLSGDHERRRPGWDIWRFSSLAFDKLGFADLGDYKIGLKVYSAENWENYPEDHYAHHPKMEAFYSGRKSTETPPSIDEWGDLVDLLRHIVVMHCEWAGIGRDDMVADDYFAGPDAPRYEYESLQGRRDDLEAMQQDTKTDIIREATRGHTDAPYEILRLMIDHPLGVTFKTLREELGTSQRTIRRHAERLEEAGIADRVGNPGELRFRSPTIHEIARETWDELDPGQTPGDQTRRNTSQNRRKWEYLRETGMTRDEFVDKVLKGQLDEDEIRIVSDSIHGDHGAADD